MQQPTDKELAQEQRAYALDKAIELVTGLADIYSVHSPNTLTMHVLDTADKFRNYILGIEE